MTHCSFCGKSQARVRGLFASNRPPACICNECLDVCRTILEHDRQHPDVPGTYQAASSAAPSLACGFCGKSQKRVDKLIGAPAQLEPCYICDRCVGECSNMLAEKDTLRKDSFLKRLMRSLNIKPAKLQRVN
ncbi:MAG TPA: ClpX C4-type zinc finger protein [Candidatus Angelobacter sp.]